MNYLVNIIDNNKYEKGHIIIIEKANYCSDWLYFFGRMNNNDYICTLNYIN